MVTTEKTISATASVLFNDIVQVCDKNVKKERLCNCVTDNLNAMSTLMTIGEKTQTRKIFNNMLKEYELFKKPRLLTCTQKLKYV